MISDVEVDIHSAIKAHLIGYHVKYKTEKYARTGDLTDIINDVSTVEFFNKYSHAKFYIKQPTFNIGDTKLVKPFNPVVGDVGYVLSDKANCGYEKIRVHNDNYKSVFGMWDNEDDIASVVEALSKLFIKSPKISELFGNESKPINNQVEK